MDRYQFEGYISDYIENTLSIAKRKEFEQFLAENPGTKDQVEDVRGIILQLTKLPTVKTSGDFMVKLQDRIATQRDVIPLNNGNRKPLIFGFTPLTLSMMSLIVLAIVFVSYELIPSATNPVAIPQQLTTNNVLSAPTDTVQAIPVSAGSNIAEAQDDSSLIEEDLQRISRDLENKINYVKTQ